MSTLNVPAVMLLVLAFLGTCVPVLDFVLALVFTVIAWLSKPRREFYRIQGIVAFAFGHFPLDLYVLLYFCLLTPRHGF